uniref:Beta-defensin-like domain-containing protein n=1 Tax=Catharus ustulatus TaxID=91951 RepID=A0A8C3U931_CATUS
MKILFLLFPLILLLLQGAAGERGGGSVIGCRRRGGFCSTGSVCGPGTRRIGKCSTFTVCCKP